MVAQETAEIKPLLEDLLVDLFWEIFRINGLCHSLSDSDSSRFSISYARWKVLGSVDRGHHTVSEISDHLNLKRQSIQRTLNLLLDEQYLVLQKHPKQQKLIRVSLTQRGVDALEVVGHGYQKWAETILGRVETDELYQTALFLREVSDSLNMALQSL